MWLRVWMSKGGRVWVEEYGWKRMNIYEYSEG